MMMIQLGFFIQDLGFSESVFSLVVFRLAYNDVIGF